MTSIPNPILSAALARPEHPVLVCGEHSLTAQQLHAAVAARAGWLAANGMGPGSVVALLASASIDWVVTYHATGWLGAAFAPLPEGQPEQEIQRLLEQLRPDLLLVSADKRCAVGSAERRVELEALADPSALQTPPAGDERFWPLDEVRAIIFTSGTTGRPRRVEVTTGQLLFSALGAAIRLGHNLHDRWLACLPLHHIGGLAILSRCALLGTCVVLHPRFDPVKVARELDSGTATLVSLVPTMLDRLLDARPEVPFPGSLRAILVGGAPMSADLIKRCRSIGAPIAPTWGMTETASQVATRIPGDLADDATSGPPLPFARVEVVDGRLTVRGPLARGGAITTDDLGRVDTRGHVHVVGRADDIMLSGGEKVVPAEVEQVLLSHPAIREAVVVARRDARWGERPVAFLVARATRVETPELTAWCREQLASFKVPKIFQWRDQLPRSETGKVERRQLEILAAQRDLAAEEEPTPTQHPEKSVEGALLRRLAESCQSEPIARLGTQLFELRSWLAGDLSNIEQGIAQLSAAQRDVAERAAAHLLAQPGKRIRPLCVLLAGRLSGRSPRGELQARLNELAITCELVHAATLLHDDVIDLGTERRGAPAARTIFGNTASILAGDHLLIEALRKVSARGTPELLTKLLEAIGEMIGAEALQLEQQHRFDPRPELYLRIVEGKTAALFRWGLEAGGTLAELPPATIAAAGRFGQHLGVAFQLIDDLLDLEGNPQRVGKDPLADVREGKLTWPLLVAAQRSPELAADLRRITRDREPLDPDHGLALVERVRATGSLAATRGAAAEHAEQANRCLEQLPDGQARRALGAVVGFCIARAS